MPGTQFSKECTTCHQQIVMQKKGDKWVALNKDFTPHTCKGSAPQKSAGPDPITGRLDLYCTTSAMFRTKNGSKTYAITPGISQEFRAAGFLVGDVHPEVWLQFTLDKSNFIQPGFTSTQKPDWAASLSDPTNGEIKRPGGERPGVVDIGGDAIEQAEKRLAEKQAAAAQQAPKETCTSPEKPAAVTPAVPLPDEERIRLAVAKMLPSDRVGCRISLAGMVNSVIEIKKTHGKPIDTEEVKREAAALFLWCDSLTTRVVQ